MQKTYDYAADLSHVKIIGDFNDFSFNSAKALEKQPDGTFAAEFETNGRKFAYQLLGLTTSGGSVNGTQSEDYVYDGGGDYRSVVTPANGRVKIVFNPDLLVRSEMSARVSFRDVNSIAARFAPVYATMRKRSKSLHDAVAAYKKTGKPLDEFGYNFSTDFAA